VSFDRISIDSIDKESIRTLAISGQMHLDSNTSEIHLPQHVYDNIIDKVLTQ
jgi:hypothetical protein